MQALVNVKCSAYEKKKKSSYAFLMCRLSLVFSVFTHLWQLSFPVQNSWWKLFLTSKDSQTFGVVDEESRKAVKDLTEIN